MVGRLLRRLAGPAAQIPKLKQTAAQRARVDTSTWATDAPIRFGLLTAASGAGVAAVGAWQANRNGLAAGWQIAVGIGGAVVGFLLAVGVIFAVEWLTAPTRQRNEARIAEHDCVQARSDARARAFADALNVKADVDRRAGLARRYRNNELESGILARASGPMQDWDANKRALGDVLEPDQWRALLTVLESFDADWDRLTSDARRWETELTATGQEQLVRDLLSTSESLVARSEQVDQLLQPLLSEPAATELVDSRAT
jgi:hypothetical protein